MIATRVRGRIAALTHTGRGAVVALLCLALLVPGCATYAPRPGPPGAALAHGRSHAVRVRLRDGRMLEVLEPVLRVDSAAVADTVLAGFVFDSRRGRRQPVSVPLRDVASVSVLVADHRANDAILTTVAVVLFTATALLLAFIGSCGDRCLD